MDSVKIAKGDKVVFAEGRSGYTMLTREDVEKFKADHYGVMRDDGETWITPSYKAVKMSGVYTVVRARCAPTLFYTKNKGMVEVVSEDGLMFYASRSAVAAVASATA